MKNYRNETSSQIKARLSEMKAVEILEDSTYAGGVPNGLEIYDLDWKGKKIEVKMSTTYPIWSWMASDKQAQAADYILLMGYKDDVFVKAYLIPKKVWAKRNTYRGLGFRIALNSKVPTKYTKYEVSIKSKITQGKNNKNIKTYTLKCLLCGYIWVSRTELPKQCPNCKRMDWNKDKNEK